MESPLHLGKATARVQTRARILLLTDRSTGEFRTNEQIAAVLLCSQSTVGNTRRRFLDEGLPAALFENPRPRKVECIHLQLILATAYANIQLVRVFQQDDQIYY